MKRIEIQKPNLNPCFIGAWSAPEDSICDEIVSFFDRNKEKQSLGETTNGLNQSAKSRIDISIKPGDICLPGYEIFQDYFDALHCCFKTYIDEWPILQEIAHTLDVGMFNVGRYSNGQHFNRIHCERAQGRLQRIFAFMTYLNDVESGGSTYFSHYDLKIQPQKGLTLIWPADWTHAHKGNVVRKGEKYIITGWLDVA